MSGCIDCGKPLSPGNKTGRCKAHFMAHLNSDPLIKANRKAGLKRAFAAADKSVMHFRAKKAAATRWANPEYAEKVRRHFKEVVQPLSYTPENLAKVDREAHGLAVSDARIPWCPREYREQYRYLTQKQHLKAAEARRIIEQQMAADKRRLGFLSPFERQMRALQNGAPLVANRRWG